MEDNSKDIKDYLIAIKKRKTAVITIALLLTLISISVAFLLPPVYKSSATILIEKQEIPSELVMSTVTSYAAERIQTIRARVMSRTNLLEIVKKFDLYPEKIKYLTSEEIVRILHEDISLDMISANVVDPRTGRPSSATIAFSVSFKSDSPSKTQKVANELTSLYLNENLKNRKQKSEETADFFDKEIERLKISIDGYESQFAKIKEENVGSLPQDRATNEKLLARLEQELELSEIKAASLKDRKFYLEEQLLQINPGNTAIVGPDQRLVMLETQYTSIISKYSEAHPDVIKVKKEIDALRIELGDFDKESAANELAGLRAELIYAENKYTSDFPDIISLKKKITSLEEKLSTDLEKPEERFYKKSPDNPAYITIKSQLDEVKSQITSLVNVKKTTTKNLDEVELKISKAPEVERIYRVLQRDYENAITNFRQTKTKQTKADVAKQLESDSKGEKFTLIDPPAYPEKPISPNRPAILIMGFIMSLGCGAGFAFLSDAISGAIRGAKSVKATLGALPLAIIPYELNLHDTAKKKRIQKRVVIVFIATIFSALLFVHFVVSPLDVLWFRVLRKIDVLTA